MPGLSFVGDAKEISAHDKIVMMESFDSMRYAANYTTKVLADERQYFLGTSSYDEYPIISFENDDFLFLLEGQLFGLNNSLMQSQLQHLARNIFEVQNHTINTISEWLLKTDGDFIILIISKSQNKVAIINDIFGRLPLYFSYTAGEIVASRDLFFISNIFQTKKIDKMALAQYLLLGYPLGERTLMLNITRLKPASIIRINLNTFDVNITTCYEFNLENKYDNNKSIRQKLNDLALLMSQSCINRHNNGRHDIVSMSGGLDSRSVASCLSKNNIYFTGVTRLTDDRKSELDAKFAKEISKGLNCNWNVYYTHPPNWSDSEKLLKMKNGSNYLAMSYIIPFLEMIKETYGTAITYWTGDGGDRILPDLRPTKPLSNMEELIKYIISERGIPLNQVIRLTNLRRNEIIDEIESRINAYPEKEWAQKYIHFLIFDRAFKFLFEGEDRNRCFFWSVTPFYSIELFKYAMNIPDDEKKGYQLYQKFLEELSFELARIDDPSHKLPRFASRDLRTYLKKMLSNKLPVEIKRKIKRYQARPSGNSYGKIILDQMNQCSDIDEYLSGEFLKESINNLSIVEVQTLLTITSVIAFLENNKGRLTMKYP